jgi:hypothetical protein
MSIDHQLEIIQENIINYFTYQKLLIYLIIIIINKIIIVSFAL